MSHVPDRRAGRAVQKPRPAPTTPTRRPLTGFSPPGANNVGSNPYGDGTPDGIFETDRGAAAPGARPDQSVRRATPPEASAPRGVGRLSRQPGASPWR